MNILHVTPDFNYGDGRSYYVSLLMKYFKKGGDNVFLCTNAGDSFERTEDFNIPVFINKSLSEKKSFLKSVNYLGSVAEENKIDIIHSHHRYFELIAASVRKKNFKTVFTALSIVDKRYFVEYESDRIIAVSNAVKKMLINKFKVNEKKISLIPNFADSSEVNERLKPEDKDTVADLKNETVCILAIGRFHKEKNFETLFQAAALLKDKKIKITLIGEGDKKKRYSEIISENSLDAVLIPPQRYLKKYYDDADICVLTSVRDPLPSFLLQSGVHCKPFIGADTDGIAEVIADGQNGLLFKPGNEFELSEKICLFIEDNLTAKKCAYNLNRLITEKYTEKAVIPQIKKLYDSLFD